jgi:hypothetical protein
MRTVSHGLVSRFVRVDDSLECLVDPRTGGTVTHHVDRNQKGKRDVWDLERSADGATFLARHSRPWHRDAKKRKQEYTVEVDKDSPSPPLDTLSLFYYLRRIPLAPGKDVSVTVFQERKAYPLTLRVQRVERMRLRGIGTFKALRIKAIAAKKGLFAEKAEVYLWVERTTHVLLRMVVDLRVGSTSMTVMTATGSPLLTAPGGRDAKR